MVQQISSILDDVAGEAKLSVFASLRRGDPAPFWLFQGVCSAWGVDHEHAQLDLITVSENAIFLLTLDNRPRGVIRVSQPGYVGGSDAVASEISWLNALHDIDGVTLVNPVPTLRGGFVTKVRDPEGTGWTAISTVFVEGAVLENLENPAPYYETIGAWSAKFHEHARTWTPPPGFTRFNWDISNMVGLSPRWGRWENAQLGDSERSLCEEALEKALDVVMRTPRTPNLWGLIHADLRPSNIIRGDDGTLTIIDFDDCGYSWFLYDYAAALSFVEHEPYAPELAQSWVKGYEGEAGPFTRNELQLMAALSMIRRLQMLGWSLSHREDALPEGLAAQQAPGSVRCAKNYLDDSLWLLRPMKGN